MSHQIDFESMPWKQSTEGARFKAVIFGNQQIRFVKFSYGFIDQDWCLKGHAGYVLDGEFAIDYAGTVERYKKGDIIFIPNGEKDKHKAILEKGQEVTLLLYEILDEE
ncbi:MAG: phosrestin [Clostridia bacterium]